MRPPTGSPSDCHVLVFLFFFFTLKWIQDMDGLTRRRSNVIFNVMALHGELIHEKKAFEKPQMKQRHTRGLFFSHGNRSHTKS